MLKILDASRYQGVIDWEKVLEDGISGAILKTVSTNNREFGGLYIDPTFERNYAECKRLGIPVGAYYYTYAQDKAYADKELALFKKAIEGKTFEYPLVVDVEDNLLKPLSADALTDLVVYALKTIESWGCYAMVYTYLNYQNTELNMARLSDYALWLAAYRDNRPTYPRHDIWQFTSSGKVEGISGNCDLNWVYKDFPSVIKANGLNGFAAEKESALSKEASRLIIGPASTGDRTTVGKMLTEREISYTVTVEGYMITDKKVTAGDKKALEIKCNQLEIDIKDLEEIESKPTDCENCAVLQKEIKTLQAELVAVHDAKLYLQKEKEELAENYGRVSKELSVANNALAAERKAADVLKADNAEMAEKINKIKDIVGG